MYLMVVGAGTVARPRLREQRRLATRREISRVALDLVLERGLVDVTVEDIAEAAGVSVRTFFNYFPSKKSAVVPGPEPPGVEAIERFVADRDQSVLDGLLKLLIECVGNWSDVRHEVERVQRAVRTYPELLPVLHQRVDEFESVLVKAVARRIGVAPDDVHPLVAAAVAGTLLRLCVTSPGEKSDESLTADLVRAHAALRDLLEA
jgi:AcrR family transcriptional regulator